MNKKLNISAITNELEGSAFFPSKKTPAPLPDPSPVTTATQHTQTTNSEPTSQGVPAPVPPGVPHTVPLIPKVKRAIKQRQPFDIYEDQYVSLKKIAEAEKDYENGRGMSQMVREAIDHYLRDHIASKE